VVIGCGAGGGTGRGQFWAKTNSVLSSIFVPGVLPCMAPQQPLGTVGLLQGPGGGDPLVAPLPWDADRQMSSLGTEWLGKGHWWLRA